MANVHEMEERDRLRRFKEGDIKSPGGSRADKSDAYGEPLEPMEPMEAMEAMRNGTHSRSPSLMAGSIQYVNPLQPIIELLKALEPGVRITIERESPR